MGETIYYYRMTVTPPFAIILYYHTFARYWVNYLIPSFSSDFSKSMTFLVIFASQYIRDTYVSKKCQAFFPEVTKKRPTLVKG